MKICSVGVELFHADGRIDRERERERERRQTDGRVKVNSHFSQFCERSRKHKYLLFVSHFETFFSVARLQFSWVGQVGCAITCHSDTVVLIFRKQELLVPKFMFKHAFDNTYSFIKRLLHANWRPDK